MSQTVERLNAALGDRYRIERELGEGGMATVYLADDLKHDRRVAIKVLQPELAAVIGGERFLAEIRTTANHYATSSSHTLYDISPDGERFLMVKRTGESPELVLVQNWLIELQARMGR